MSNIDLNEQETQILLKCLNDGIEPPAEVAKKLFPSVCGTWDVAKLNRATISIIEYAGKRKFFAGEFARGTECRLIDRPVFMVGCKVKCRK